MLVAFLIVARGSNKKRISPQERAAREMADGETAVEKAVAAASDGSLPATLLYWSNFKGKVDWTPESERNAEFTAWRERQLRLLRRALSVAWPGVVTASTQWESVQLLLSEEFRNFVQIAGAKAQRKALDTVLEADRKARHAAKQTAKAATDLRAKVNAALAQPLATTTHYVATKASASSSFAIVVSSPGASDSDPSDSWAFRRWYHSACSSF